MTAPLPSDPAWLAQLHDVVAPPVLAWWPPAPAWWLLALLGVLVMIRQMRMAWRRWRANVYRRQALRVIRQLAARTAPPAEAVVTCLALLRRCCLAVKPRGTVVAATGPQWAAMLTAMAPKIALVDDRLRQLLSDGAYRPPQTIARADAEALLAFTRHWIQGHRA